MQNLISQVKGVVFVDPMMMDFPTEIYTDRLLIRIPLPGDGKKVYEAVEASINELIPWLPFAQKEQSEIKTEIGIRNAHAKFLTREDLRLLIFLKDNKQFIGSSGLHNPNWDIPKFEIGYWIDAFWWKRLYDRSCTRNI
jgi:ribosomal-protein-serine acetyltransferase